MTTTYKIGEAAQLLNLKSYVLRFWETEFPEIAPLRTEKGQRLYTRQHLALLERIRYLLHERGLTIGGARKVLAEEKERGVSYIFGTTSAVGIPDPFHGPEGGFPAAQAEGQANGQTVGQDGLMLDSSDFMQQPPLGNGGQRPGPTNGHWDHPAPQGWEDGRPELSAFGPNPYQDGPYGHGISGPHTPFSSGSAARTRPQYNLPGLDKIVALREAMAAEKASEALSPPEAGQPGLAPSVAQGMLPLFAMVRSAFLAGKAAGAAMPGPGGDNFIQAGASPAANGSGEAAPRDILQEILAELESLAAELGGPKPRGDGEAS